MRRPSFPFCTLIFLAFLAAPHLQAQLALNCNPPNLGPDVVGAPYTMTCFSSGSFGPVTFSASGLPPGINVTSITSGSITIAGVATVSTNYDFTLQADDFFFMVTNEFTGFIAPQLTFICPDPGVQTANVPFSFACSVAGGNQPYGVSLVSGTLPPTVEFSFGEGGVLFISGSPPSPGAFTFSLQVRDSSRVFETVTLPITIFVDAPAPPLLASCPFNTGTQGQPFNAQCTATGGVAPYHFSAVGLPAGLSIGPLTGLISGIPPGSGGFGGVVNVTDSSTPGVRTAATDLGGTINFSPLSVSCGTVTNPILGQIYTLACTGTGGVMPFTWSATGLPKGLSINPTTGVIGGTPTDTSGFSATISAVDSSIPRPQMQSTKITGSVVLPPLTINCGTAGKLSQGQFYALECLASGGTKPYQWSAGGLPTGIAINATSGLISGTPTVAGTFSATITVTDNTGQSQSASINGTVAPAPLVLDCPLSLTLVQNQPFSQACTVSQGTPSYHWSATGLPTGVSIDPTTGSIGGKASGAGPFSATITVTDSTTPVPESQTATVAGVVIPGLTSQTSDAVAGAPFSFDVTQIFSQILADAPPGVGSFVFSISGGTLPPGLNLAGSLITGTPTEAGNYVFTITLASTTPGGSSASANFGAKFAPHAASQSYGPFSDSMNINVAGNSRPAVDVNPGSLTYSFTKGTTKQATQSLVISNSGTTPQSYSVNISTGSGGNWLSASSQGGNVEPASTSTVTVSVDPSDLGIGTYMGTVSIKLSDTEFDVPVTVVVSGGQAMLQLSQTGFRFQTVNGGADPFAQNLTILASGAGSLKFTASAFTKTGGPWLSVSPGAGNVSASTPAQLKVHVSAGGLAPGNYYGQIEIDSGDAANSPQLASVVLNVSGAAVDLGAFVYPTGLVFVAQEGGADPAPQVIAVTNPSKSTLTFTSASFFGQGTGLFTVQPSSGTVDAANPIQLTVQPALSGVPANVYFGEIVLTFAENQTSRHIEVLIVVTPASGSGNTAAHAQAPGCTPTKLIPVFTQLGADFATVAAWPTAVEVIVVDDCGNFLTNGSVTASFSDGDPSLPLSSLNDGHWSATWQPINSRPSVVITVDAQELLPKLQGAQAIGGTLQTNPTAPSVAGVGSPAKALATQPLAPGSFISIYGLHLSAGTNAALSLPLATELGATQVVLGARQLPLLYSADGQVNALIPYDVPPNSTQQLIVTNGPALSVPAPVTIAATQPAVFANANGSGIVDDYKPNSSTAIRVDASHPIEAGDAIVIYAAGLGPVNPPVAAGSAAPSSPPAITTNPVTVKIGGKSAQVFFSGLVGGFAGLYQVNAYVPSGVAPGDAVPLVVSVAGFDSAAVTVAVK